MKNSPGVIWIKIAAVYFVLGVSLGAYMGASGDHTMRPVHAHINLLGWATMAIIGLIYRQFPELANTLLARIHFWIHNLGLPLLMLMLACLLRGYTSLEPVLGIASIFVVGSIVLFAVNIFKNLKGQDEA